MTSQTDEISAAIGGDEAAFAALTERHRRELHIHCYRMLASFDDAEDAVQETFLRAWRSRDSFDGSSLFRAWLYRIATNVCVDAQRRNSRRVASMQTFRDVPWLQPYPDSLLDEVEPSDQQPDAVVVERETIELVFLAAMQVLPPRQRAALIARDVLGWPAVDAATLLETSAPADRYRLPDGTVFGIISSTTDPFCSSCDRSRLTADGMWYRCLYATSGTDLRTPLRAGMSPDDLLGLLTKEWTARADRGAEERLAVRDRSPLVPASSLKKNPHLEMHTRGG
jgi:RNA polymerase sigma factor (sigma-70 family)